jgi:hypothetical protein
MPRAINSVPQYFTDDGIPLSGGLVYYYRAGTTTDLETYTDETAAVPNTQPVVLDAAGRLPDVWHEGSAKVVVKNSDGDTIWERDPVGGIGLAGAFVLWDTVISYSQHDIVRGSDGLFYISLVNTNQSFDPVTPNPSKWTEIRFITMWNTNETYNQYEVVQDTLGNLYSSLTAANIANIPASSPTKWYPAIDASKLTEITNLEADVSTLQGEMTAQQALDEVSFADVYFLTGV